MTKFVYVVPENHYSILDQTGEVKLKDCPELKEVSFMYSTDLYIEYTEPINLELEKIRRWKILYRYLYKRFKNK